MTNLIFDKIIADTCYLGVTLIFGVTSFYIKKFLNSKKDFLEHEKNILKEKLGIEQYKKDVSIAKNIVLSIEEIAKSYDWKGAIKHSNAVELIKKKTNLKDDDIDMIIKSVVAGLNKGKPKIN